MPATATHPDGTVGIVTPLANEEATIEELLDRTLVHLGPDDRVYLVVDNVSTDRTRDIVASRTATDERIVEVWAPENRCVVDAYVRGYREALDAGHEWVLEMDGGLSHHPEEIPRFFAAMRDDIDFAMGSRFCRDGSYEGRGKRWVLSRGGTLLARAVLGIPGTDLTSGFEAFHHTALRAVLDRGLVSRAHFFQTEIRYLLSDARTVEVPISYRDPSARVGRAALRDALTNLVTLRRRPTISPTDINARIQESS